MEEVVDGTLSYDLLSRLKELLKRERQKMNALRDALKRLSVAEEYLKKGKAIQANLAVVPEGVEKAELTDFDGKTVLVELDPRKSAVQNMEHYFNLYKKMKSGKKKLRERIKETETRIAQLERSIRAVERGDDRDDAERLVENLSRRKRTKGAKRMKKRLRRFVSSDGYEIYVGRNERENDYLSLRFAKRDDIFLHTSGYPGSHIIIRTKGKVVPEQTIQEAGMLAVHYSKARRRGTAPVSFTECRNVRKPKGTKRGTVLIHDFHTIDITVDDKVIERLLSQLAEGIE